MEFYYHETDRDVLVLRADGGLNADTAEQFVGELEALVDAGLARIIVDCEHLEHVSSYGMMILVRLRRKLAGHGGDVKLACVRSRLAGLLGVAHLDRVFGIYPDVNQARLAFRPAGGR